MRERRGAGIKRQGTKASPICVQLAKSRLVGSRSRRQKKFRAKISRFSACTSHVHPSASVGSKMPARAIDTWPGPGTIPTTNPDSAAVLPLQPIPLSCLDLSDSQSQIRHPVHESGPLISASATASLRGRDGFCCRVPSHGVWTQGSETEVDVALIFNARSSAERLETAAQEHVHDECY